MRDDLTIGSKLGPYSLLAPIGAGGMGEVWKARDSRLNRLVAIKFLRQEVRQRFQSEARAVAALNHPNVAQIYDVGDDYLVMEFVDGEPLTRPESLSKLLEIAVQIAQGLAAAHEAGIVHRDLKPDNIRVTRTGRVKLLDFGIARQSTPDATREETKTATATTTGHVVGTLAYMSPEQVTGQAIDHRSDIFSFGIVLCELVTGSRAFERATSTETMAAILRDDTPELPANTPPALARIIAHALEKKPEMRFQSTNDLVFALQNAALSTTSVAALSPATAVTRRRFVREGIAAAALVAATGLGYWGGRRSARSKLPAFRKVPTGAAARVFAARFAADGETVVYTIKHPDGASDLAFVGRGDQGPRDLKIPDLRRLVAISSSNELAVLLKGGVLARVPLSGGAPRKLVEGVVSADWIPGSESLAIIRETTGGKASIEFPIGKAIGEIEEATAIRVAPDGKSAVVAHGDQLAYQYLTIYEPSGKKTTVSSFKAPTIDAWPHWSPNGNEIWISSPIGAERTIYAIDPRGNRRALLTLVGLVELEDVSPKRDILIDMIDQRFGLMGLTAGTDKERDLSLNDEYTFYSPLSEDGKTFTYTNFGTNPATTYLRRLDEEQAVRLCDGAVNGRLSPDLRWAPVTRNHPRPATFLVPTGAGTEKELVTDMTAPGVIGWLSNETCVLAGPGVSDHLPRVQVWNLTERKGRLLFKGNFDGIGCDRDGHVCIVQPEGSSWKVFPIDGSSSLDLRGLEKDERPLAFSKDYKTLYVGNPNLEKDATVWLLDWTTGKRQIWKEFTAPPGRELNMGQLRIAPDGRSYFYPYEEYRSELYTADGIV
jgi:predicted Ser/Thr protein kinase